ncbi:MAG: sigma-54-dependent Fis family transcriptional regulator [Nitrospiraceae bacterium]|nr:MAG: sigma-54-dependent Fis family transcriptional regulator [Nitrospiraceae bacterium]
MRNGIPDSKPDLGGLSILVIDDEMSSQDRTERELSSLGARVYPVPDSAGAAGVLSQERVHVILLSLPLADEKCLALVKEYKAKHPDTLFYLLTGQNYSFVEPVEESVRRVLDDYFRKPLDTGRFAGIVGASFGRPPTSTSLSVIEPLSIKAKPYFIFRSYPMRLALADLPRIAASEETVLVSGETGTGKELVARAVHMLSRRSNGPFVPINCGAIPESLIESELFGHEKGSFTGAYKSRKGKFEAAHNGTLFLDEIGDMPLLLQTRLLRVLEDKEIYRVGSDRKIPVNVRVITATHTDLENAVKNGLFREDLYYRLNVLRVHLPPLRERIDDIPVLALHFLERTFDEMGRPAPYPAFSPETVHLLQQYPWKGNVRELRNIMTRVATLLPPDTTRVFPAHILPHLGEAKRAERSADLPQPPSGVVVPAGMPLEKAEEMLIHEALKQAGGNRTRAAKLLGISIRTLRRRLNRNTH